MLLCNVFPWPLLKCTHCTSWCSLELVKMLEARLRRFPLLWQNAWGFQLTGEKAYLAYNCRSFHQWLAVFSCCWACWGKKSWWKGIAEENIPCVGQKAKREEAGRKTLGTKPTSSEASQWSLPHPQKPLGHAPIHETLTQSPVRSLWLNTAASGISL